ncbi:hypothetical protein NM688_g1576 [Phlebia brevispora]|uniref:Uncharacterized protein n=1 Tax=Phlebia brevispora TaxID=194682 RepID=A0ACC1TBE4_9APHY|nr:hypothetical protein NM688_g1576 [Phlebia brevispora]
MHLFSWTRQFEDVEEKRTGQIWPKVVQDAGLKYVSKHRRKRILAIASLLAGSDYDVGALQELWVFADYEHVRDTLSRKVPHSKFFYRSGLVVFSRYPILEATVHPYSLDGSPIDVLAGDCSFIMGGDEDPDHFKTHRLVSAWEFAKLARQSAEMGRDVIAAPPMVIIRDHASLKDACVETQNHVQSTSSGIPSPVDAIHMYGVTADSPLNSCSAGKPLESYTRKYQGKRLD